MTAPSDAVPTDPTPMAGAAVPRLRIRGLDEAGGKSSSGGYFLIRDGRQQGPLSREAVVTLIQAAHASPLDLGWREGETGWRPLGDLFPGVRPLVRPLHSSEVHPLREKSEPQAFYKEVLPSLSYPFRGDGGLIMAGGTAAVFVLWLVGSAMGGLGVLAIGFSFLIYGYLLGSLQIVIQASAQGEPDIPKWPEIRSATSDCVQPFRLWVTCQLVCFAPALVAGFLATVQSSSTFLGMAIAFTLAGAFCFPMSLLAVAMADTGEAIDPVFIYRSIRAVGWDYLLLLAVLALLVTAHLAGNVAAEHYQIPGLRMVWSSANAVYFGVVLARLLGVFYYSNRERLGWF